MTPCTARRPTHATPWLGAGLVLAACGGAETGGVAMPSDATVDGPTPDACAPALRLYANPDCQTLREGVVAFEPQFPFWSDGTSKTRFVHLPADGIIDTSDPDAWVFPVGTLLGKHFETPEGLRLETRVLEKVADVRGPEGWAFETYAWDASGGDVERVVRGREDVLGTGHDIPEQDACSECHSGGANQHEAAIPAHELLDLALGFGAIQLSHEDSATTLRSLVAAGRLSHDIEEAVVPGHDVARHALGYLHANCGPCHGGPAPRKDMDLVVPVGVRTVEDTPTFLQTVGVPTDRDSRATGIQDMPAVRIAPGDAAGSAIVWRMGRRGDDDAPMPPLATKVVHQAGVEDVAAWIDSL